MDMIEVLEKLGLNEKQASVYVALLELGTASVYGIAQKAGIKRPTTYLVLDELKQKGLVNVIPRNKKILYAAESPEQLSFDLKKKQDLLSHSLPQLLASFNKRKDKPQVQLYEGKEGVRQVYEKIFNSGGVSLFGTTQEVAKMFPEGLASFLKNISEKRIQVKELIIHSPQDDEYRQAAQKMPNHQFRFVPIGLTFPTDSALFGDSVVFFSFQPELFAVMITSREVSQSLKTLFELAWRSAEVME